MLISVKSQSGLLLFSVLSLLLTHQQLFAAESMRAATPYCNEANLAIHQTTELHRQTAETLLQTADTFTRLGRYQQAIAALCVALTHLPLNASHQQAIILGQLGHAYFRVGNTPLAITLLKKSLNTANALKQPITAAVALNYLGDVYALSADKDKPDNTEPDETKHDKALSYYQQSQQLATKAGDNILAANAMLNQLRTLIKTQNLPSRSARLPCTSHHLLKLRNTVNQIQSVPEKVTLLLRLAKFSRLAYVHCQVTNKAALQLQAYQVLNQALKLAQQYGDIPAQIQAIGSLGQLYQDQKRYAEALRLTRQAVFLAQAHDDTEELRYYWQWQIGNLLKQQGHKSQALLAYHQAITTLSAIRCDFSRLARGFQSTFRGQVGPLFLDLIALLLEHANRPLPERQTICQLPGLPKTTRTDQYPCLHAAQETLEQLKAAELIDYYQNDCMIKPQQSLTQIDLAQDKAVLYPIIFADKLELLLHTSDKIIRKTVNNVPRHQLKTIINQFRYELEKRHNYANEDFLAYAQQLYDWLIRPFTADNASQTHPLAGIKTLIFVPDGVLRTIPIAALHDGDNYLIHHYAIAVAPGLTLTTAASENKPALHPLLLAGGLDFEQNIKVGEHSFAPLDTAELNQIKASMPTTEEKPVELLNHQFTYQQLQNQLTKQAYSILHISSHAVFDADIKKSFILLGNGQPLFLEQFGDLLNQTHQSSPHLVTLSACETALGDDRAALGLGGIAFRAGAQSAMATLWKADLWFTTRFMPLFYQKLSAGLPKAQALQQTQLDIITNPQWTQPACPVCHHPYFWAPFILIGENTIFN